jgi:hypothetical protein
MTSFQLQNPKTFSSTDEEIVERLLERLNVMNSNRVNYHYTCGASTVCIALTGLIFDSLGFCVFVSWKFIWIRAKFQ